MQRKYWTLGLPLDMITLRQTRIGFNEMTGTAILDAV
jgi:hypothetical protein